MYVNIGKRFFDILIAISAIIILLPIMLIVAVLIKVFDPGPTIFKQKRVGKNGNTFDFYKFRSMPVNTGDLPSDKLGQLKLTWIGRFVRRTNLDELPQLFNVLRGDMSIVGPRPPIPVQEDLILLRKKSGAIKCRPGLTGLAQVSAFDGMPLEKKADFDALYAHHISLWGDIKIIGRTFLYLLKPPPVY